MVILFFRIKTIEKSATMSKNQNTAFCINFENEGVPPPFIMVCFTPSLSMIIEPKIRSTPNSSLKYGIIKADGPKMKIFAFD